ncbi:MAG: hypothetical protein AB4352_09180 [Hormoscilla sp.]
MVVRWRIHAIVNVGVRHPQMTGGDEKCLYCRTPVVTVGRAVRLIMAVMAVLVCASAGKR